MESNYYKLVYKGGEVSCNLPDDKDYAMEFGRLMILCQKKPLVMVRIKPRPSVIVAGLDKEVNAVIVSHTLKTA